MGEHSGQLVSHRRRASGKPPKKQPPAALGRRLLDVIVYKKNCRIGAKISADDLEDTEVGDWKMPDFRAACIFAVSQGWVVVENDVLTLTTAGLAAA